MTSPELVAGPSKPDVDRAFELIIAEPNLRTVVDAADRESRRRDVSRIASTLFCSTRIDPSIVTFAKHRTAAYWGLDEERVDVLVAQRLLEKTALLIQDLHDSGLRHADLYGPGPAVRAA
jgi:hypothetical protein